MDKARTAKLHQLTIHEEYRQLVLPCSGDVLRHMEEQIRRYGCQTPVPVWSGRLLVDFDRMRFFSA